MMNTVKLSLIRFSCVVCACKKTSLLLYFFFPYRSRVVETFMRCLATQCNFQ